MATRACEVNISTMNEEGAATARLAPTMPLPGTAPEVTVRSALLGLLLGVVFAGATSFIALKLGEGIEPAIPIAVMVVGLAAATGRKATTLQNLNAVTVGATSGAVGVGAAFTVPALFILGLGHSAGVAALVLLPLAGAALGVLFLLPLRRYFVAELHGKLPFPEAVAITETLIASDQGGGRARVLMRAMAAAFGIDLASTALGLWKDTFSTADFPALSALTDRAKLVFSMNTSAAMLGIGYLIGLRYAVIICAGSALTWFVIVPVAAQMHPEFATLGAVDIFDRFARDIGIGAVCAAGFIGTVRMAPAMLGALRQVGREFVEHRTSGSTPLAADRDLSLPLVVALIAAIAALLWLYFRLELSWTPYPGWVATAVVTVTLVTAFLFAAISAWSTAMMASTPLSGLTLTALIAAALVLRLLGVAGPQAMVAVVGIGAVVCTCQSMASTIVSEWKVGHTLGSSPRIISASNLLGSVVAAAVVGGVMLLLDQAYGFGPTAGRAALPAPQPNAMAAVISTLLGGGEGPWLRYGVGAAIALVAELAGLSSLAFALGLYIPLELELPVLVGAWLAFLVGRSAPGQLGAARQGHGTLVASGLIAGGSLAGVAAAGLRWASEVHGQPLLPELGIGGPLANWIGLGVLAALFAWVYWDARRIQRV